MTTETTAEPRSLPLLTASRMRCFRSCPRLHQLRYVEGWRPTVEAEALRFGTLMHTGLEAWWGGAARGLDRLAVALDAVRGKAIDPYEQARVDVMMEGYELAWGLVQDDYEVIDVEARFEAALINPDTMATSRTWALAGKVDAIARRRSDGRVLVVEHKGTVEEIESDASHYWSTLAMDHQISVYVIGAESLGHEVDEILYDVLRKIGDRPLMATAPEARKYTKDGRLYAAQRETDETPDEYHARIREKVLGNLPRYFQRRAIARTQGQIADFLADAWAQGRTMREMELANRAPRSPEACHRFGTCSFWNVCSTGSHPSSWPAEFRQVADVHPELSR